ARRGSADVQLPSPGTLPTARWASDRRRNDPDERSRSAGPGISEGRRPPWSSGRAATASPRRRASSTSRGTPSRPDRFDGPETFFQFRPPPVKRLQYAIVCFVNLLGGNSRNSLLLT